MNSKPVEPVVGVPPYTPEEFRAAVLAVEPRSAVFDCDGTLWAPDSGYGFMLWSLEQGLPTPDRADWITERYRRYEAGSVDEATICGEMVQLYAGLREDQVREAAQIYVQSGVEPEIFPEMAALVTTLRDAGAEIWAVSSTSAWVIEAAVWRGGQSGFGIAPDRILAVEIAVENGIITDTLLAVPTDEAKAEALERAGVTRPDVVFGNSIHDAAMLSIAAHPFPVNPNAGLTAFAAERGWRCFQPVKRG